MPSFLRIELSFKKDVWMLRLTDNESPVQEIRTLLKKDQLDEIHATFRTEVEGVFDWQRKAYSHLRKWLAGVPLRERDAHLRAGKRRICRETLLKLEKQGTKTTEALFAESARTILREALIKTHPDWEAAEHIRPRMNPQQPWKFYREQITSAKLELLAEEQAFFPLDMLPWFGNDEMTDVETNALRFPAMSMQVTRLFKGPMNQSTKLCGDSLPAAALASGDLPAAEREVGFLEQMSAFHGPVAKDIWLSEEDLRHPGSMTRRLANKLTQDSGGVVHLACHAATEQNASEQLLVVKAREVKHGIRPEVRISLASLDKELNLRRRKRTEGSRPLVFLNACGSMYHTAQKKNSFASMLWRNGNLGFIGTEVNTGDASAADMAKLFYHFMHAGCPAPRALQLARLQLLSERDSPAGLIYSYYGSPELKVSKPLHWSYPPLIHDH
jgi:CHAT domain